MEFVRLKREDVMGNQRKGVGWNLVWKDNEDKRLNQEKC